MGDRPKSVEPRFDARFVVQDDGCWVWIGTRSPAGYGRISVNGRMLQAHRVAYERWIGQIPEGLTIDHLCRNRACVNPAHMEPVTNRENLLRGDGPSAIHAVKTHCPAGHPYNGDNLRRGSRGERKCRECNRIQKHIQYWSNPEAARATKRKGYVGLNAAEREKV